MRRPLPGRVRWIGWLAVLIVALPGPVGCAGKAKTRAAVNEANTAYHRGDYATAYRTAGAAVAKNKQRGRSSPMAYEAAYLAGISAVRLGKFSEARRYLTWAVRSPDDRLAGDAAAELGLVSWEQGRYADASRMFLLAAPKLEGQERALAYYHAAAAQQALGRHTEARTYFTLARPYTRDPRLLAQIDQRRGAAGYTLQTGAYAQADNARRAAEGLGRRVRGAAPRLVVSTDARGRSVTLVQIGQFATHDSALRFRSQLGQPDAVIVPLH